jgi:transposase-like protein
MFNRQKYEYANYLVRTIISKHEWFKLKPRQDKVSMERKRDIAIAMVEKGVSQSLIAMSLDTSRNCVQYWLRNDAEFARKIRRTQWALARKGLAEFQLWSKSHSTG